MTHEPVSRDERARLFAAFSACSHVGLAVSGGADSLALMHLVAAWSKENAGPAPELSVLTVDHGLRAESAREAQFVCDQAEEAGLKCHVLSWEPGRKTTRIQEHARQARYDLTASCALEHGIDAIATAHHLDDQAETVLMRLARGSGVDGLVGICAVSQWGGVALLRPFLDLPKARLVASLEAIGAKWIEDPSNDDDAFERVRVRKAMGALEALGIGAAELARSAARLRRAADALEQTAATFLHQHSQIGETGYCRIDAGALASAPDEIALRALSRALRGVGGRIDAPRLAKLEQLLADIRGKPEGAATLGGCVIRFGEEELLIMREGGERRGPREMVLEPGQAHLWDGRYRVSLAPSCSKSVEVRPLGQDALRQVKEHIPETDRLPTGAAAGMVSFWHGDKLLCVPPLGFVGAGPGAKDCAAKFANSGLFNPIR